MANNQRVLSGVQPTNNLHLGNYLGAIKNWVSLQNDYECFYCVVDLHAITIKQNPDSLRRNIINTAKTYIALGVDPKKSTIFVQSDVKEHAELGWILNTIAKLADLERMTQFKDKAAQHQENINVGLFTYPTLMSADILLYDPQYVPVGEDQLQHVELTRVLARKFNQLYGETFKIPEPFIKKDSARIMGLDNPTKKMSKSAASEYNYIALLDDPATAAKKIKKAVTDSSTEIKAGKDKPALSNLLTIYSLLSKQGVKKIEALYKNKGYGEFKTGLTEVVNDFLSSFQYKFNQLDDKRIKQILEDGAKRARNIATKKMSEIKRKIGLGIE